MISLRKNTYAVVVSFQDRKNLFLVSIIEGHELSSQQSQTWTSHEHISLNIHPFTINMYRKLEKLRRQKFNKQYQIYIRKISKATNKTFQEWRQFSKIKKPQKQSHQPGIKEHCTKFGAIFYDTLYPYRSRLNRPRFLACVLLESAVLLEPRQYKNNSIQSKIIPIFKLARFFPHCIGGKKERQFQFD